MMVSLMAALALLGAQDAPVVTAPAPIEASVPSNIPVLDPAVASADCGGLLRIPAFCVSARMDQIGALGEAYTEQLASQNWLAAGGDDNRIVFIKRREGGGCDGLQMVAFFHPDRPQTAEEIAYLGFANIPGDVCVAPAGGATQ